MSSIASYVHALWVVVLPLLVMVLPGLPLGLRAAGSLSDTVAHIFLWSIALCITLLSLAATVGLPGVWVAVVFSIGALAAVAMQRRRFQAPAWQLLLIGVVYVALFLFMAMPFLLGQYGLPTGDSQKAVYWAKTIAETGLLPDYQQSVAALNRDPVDFLTPGLHAIVALFMQTSPIPLTSIGLWAILLALTTGVVAAATATALFPKLPRLAVAATVLGLLLTNFRFLRYVREPGYHLQNILGELLLFGLLYVGIQLYHHASRRDVVLAALLCISLAISHQFSAFLAAFALLPLIALLFFATTRRMLAHSTGRKTQLLAVIVAMALVALAAGVYLDLFEKIPHLFTSTPHLLHLVPSVDEYALLLGAPWLFLGIGGFAYLIVNAYKRRLTGAQIGWLASSLVLLLLSQGPRFGMDIPPVRALFYSIVPLSISGAVLLLAAWHAPRTGMLRYLVRGLAAVLLLAAGITSVKAAFTPALQARTNSTYTPGQEVLVEYIATQPEAGGVLVDDYNRRSASWLLLGHHPMYTRLAADISQQMAESTQSSLRHALYLNQLDYEKIFSLGSLPEIMPLLARHRITWVTGIDGSSVTSFQYNPVLAALAGADDITLFSPQASSVVAEGAKKLPPDLSTWLLKPTTLANDIGDAEDTFEHLPVSLRTPRLSEPKYTDSKTSRTTTSPIIPLRFNVGDFVQVLWSKEQRQQPDTALEFMAILAQPDIPLTVRTANGAETPFVNNTLLRLESWQVPYEGDGFITLYLLNPQQHEVRLDVIALGLARVP